MAKITGKRRNNRSREDLEKIKLLYELDHPILIHKGNITKEDCERVREAFGAGCKTPLTKTEAVDKTLEERGKRYGDFVEHARITQAIKKAMVDSSNWPTLSDDKKEALEMVAHKIGRILNGDPEFHDSWHDILGYVRLVEATLRDFPELSEATAISTSPKV